MLGLYVSTTRKHRFASVRPGMHCDMVNHSPDSPAPLRGEGGVRGSLHASCSRREPLTRNSLRKFRPLPARAGRGNSQRFALGSLKHALLQRRHADSVQTRKPRVNLRQLGCEAIALLLLKTAGSIMKIGTLLTAAIVSLSTVGGGLAVYVAVTKYQTMDKISAAQSRLGLVRAVGDIPRYLNPERGFATNILFGPLTVEAKHRAELNDKYRRA